MIGIILKGAQTRQCSEQANPLIGPGYGPGVNRSSRKLNSGSIALLPSLSPDAH
jgi:hypothetical protein